jgi:sarcosine oxidase subunit alpha
MRINRKSSLLTEVQRGRTVKVNVDGKIIEAHEGETIAAALLSAGIRVFQLNRKDKGPRGLYCGMGVCYDCLVTVDGVHAIRACMTYVADGMRVETCQGVQL